MVVRFTRMAMGLRVAMFVSLGLLGLAAYTDSDNYLLLLAAFAVLTLELAVQIYLIGLRAQGARSDGVGKDGPSKPVDE